MGCGGQTKIAETRRVTGQMEIRSSVFRKTWLRAVSKCPYCRPRRVFQRAGYEPPWFTAANQYTALNFQSVEYFIYVEFLGDYLSAWSFTNVVK